MLLPIRDHNPSGRTPYVTWALIAVNAAAFLSILPLHSDPHALQRAYGEWALYPGSVTAGRDWSGLVTSMFLHGGWLHLGGNMLFLWIFGDNLEDEMGHLGYLGFYLAGGVGAGLAHVLASPESMVPTVGASGAVAAVMGGYLLLHPRAGVDVLAFFLIFIRIFTVPAWLMLIVWFGFQLLGGAGSDPHAGGVAYWAHAGGFVIGLLLAVPVWLKLGGAEFWSRTHGHRDRPKARYRGGRTGVPLVRRRRRR